MARTYTYNDALTAVGYAIRREHEDALAAYACNMALNLLWNYTDWRETLAELPPFWLVPSTQDYGKPVYAVPSDFLGLREAYSVNLQGNYNDRYAMTVQKNLEQTQIRDIPTLICYREAIAGFRVWPRVPESITCPNWYVTGTYKKRPVKVSVDSFNTLLPWDDQYFQVFVEVLKWAFMIATRDGGAPTQFSVALGMMDTMASQEGLNLGDGAVAPREGLINPFYFAF